jgi:thiamine-monophosphate kinase
MKVSRLGEFNLIDRLTGIVNTRSICNTPAWNNLMVGIGDDAAVWQSESGQAMASTDCLIEGIHFTLDTITWYDLGRKAIAVNLSDIAAMGGSPRYAFITLGLPGNTDARDIVKLYNGMVELAERYEVTIAGGDTNSAPVIFINVAVFGQAGAGILRRGGAKSGDLIAVTGSLGAAGGGLRLLMDHKPISKDSSPLREAFISPCPRLEMGRYLVDSGVRCAIDVSDGLVADLGHICHSSGAGALVNIETIPVHPALTPIFGQKALDIALSGGEDYELVFTAPAKIMRKVQEKAPCAVSIIGTITAEHPGEVCLVRGDGIPYFLDYQGWQHFGPNHS